MGLIVLSTMQCPTSINLTQLAQGTLDDISVANIERHLLTSETCRQSLAQIEIALDDPLSQRLKNADALFHAKSSRHQKFSVVIPGFRIIKQLGSGGMGTVYEAVDEKSGEIRAIKVLHSERQFDKNIVEGGKLNREYQEYYSKLFEKHTAIGNELNAKMEQLSKEGVDISTVAESMQLSAYQELFNWQLQYAKENPTIVGYGIFAFGVRQVIQSPFEVEPYSIAFQTVFAPKYPNHPYTAQLFNVFTGSSLKAGVPFIDFTAVDLNGKSVKLSELIAGKPAVLNLWASWCGPCRRKGKELIPVYEEFSDKGFVVVGVARERVISTAEAAIKLDKYPWENLVELSDVEQIWDKYGIGNAGGSIFLIDENGIIVAVSPTTDEIRNFLLDKFK